MEPLNFDIRFCRTHDGVRIASSANGSGPHLVRTGTWLGHVELETREPDSLARLRWLGDRFTFLRYDSRGCGLSDRQVDEVTFDGLLADLEAVMDSRSIERATLLGVSAGAALAIAYAAKHPERVERLVLMNGFFRGYFSAPNLDPALRAEADLLLKNAEVGWDNPRSIFRHVFLAQMLGTAGPQEQRVFEERMRQSMDGAMAAKHLRCDFAIDVKAQCARVTQPTLVFHCRGDEMVSFQQGRNLAALIPGARFIPLEYGGHHLLWSDPAARVFERELEAFMPGGGTVATAPQLTARQREVLRAVAQGKTDKQIARDMELSPRTVEMHVAGAMRALECATRAAAVSRAGASGLLEP